MQDKEIDQVFKDKLEHAELPPPSHLWARIEDQLEPKKKKSTAPMFWVAAAAALVLMAAGLIFTKTEKVQLQSVAPLAAVTPSPRVSALPNIANEAPELEEPYHGTPLLIAPSININYPERDSGPLMKKKIVPVQPRHGPNRLKGMEAIDPEALVADQDPATEVQMLASVDPENHLPDAVENEQARKRGFRNVGDLVNFVIEKVDKREDKLLKFNTDQDDNSSLVAVNIGFIKLNSKNTNNKQHK